MQPENGISMSTLLQFDVEKRVTLVDYPGLVLNPSKALEALGGEKEISKALVDRNKRINLYLRPKDSEAHPVAVERHDFCGVLLRVRRRKKPPPSSEDSEPQPCQVEVLGIATSIYSCSGLADFQFLPPGLHTTPSGETQHLAKVDDISDSALLDAEPGLLHLPSAVFARQDKAATGLRAAVKRIDRGQANHVVHFAGSIPTEPSQLEGSPAIVNLLNELFSKRPIWSNLALTNVVKKRLKITAGLLKKAVQSTAYYFPTGPWRLLWTHLGYDPRKEQSAAMYQCLDFRTGRTSIFRGDKHTGRTSRTGHLPLRGKRTCTLLEEPETEEGSVEAGDEQSHEIHAGLVIGQRNVLLQFCDIHIPSVQSLLQSKLQDTCTSDRDGWFTSGTVEEVRALLFQELQIPSSKQSASADPRT